MAEPEETCEVMEGPHCYCHSQGRECCWCDLGLGNCRDGEEEEGRDD